MNIVVLKIFLLDYIKEKEQYYIIYSTTGKSSINLINDDMEVYNGWNNDRLFTFGYNQNLIITILFTNKDNVISYVILINNPSEYKRIVNILEILL